MQEDTKAEKSGYTDADRETIYRTYYGKVFGYVRSRITNVSEAEDITADVFVKVYENLDSFDESKSSLSTWIYTVTRNTLYDRYRTRKVSAELTDELAETLADDTSVEDDCCNAEELDALADALEALDKRERDILLLRYYSGKTLREIAARMDISYAYVKILQNKALDSLKKILEKE